MTRAERWVAAAALGFALAAFAAGPAPARASEARKVTERTFEFSPGGEVVIQNQNGRITIEAWTRPQVRVQVTRVARASGREAAESYLKQIRSEVEIRDGRIKIVSHYPKRKETTGFFALLVEHVASFQTHYYLQVPVETALDLSTSNGQVRVRGTRGGLEAGTTNGNIEITNVGGPVETHSTNGGIEVRGGSGSLSAETTNGGIEAEIRSLAPDGRISAQTTNGGVSIALPAGVKADLHAATTNGRVSVSFPVSGKEIMTTKVVRGTINGGGAEITLSTTNGDINVERLGGRRPR
jgi:DUF4097 and DUF4098 domain-containing protein YvlB